MDALESWKDQRNVGRLHAYAIPPGCLEDSYTEIEGVLWSTLSISANYETDTRVQAKLSYLGDADYPRSSLVRITYEIRERGYERVLGTFIVTNDNATRQNGQWKTTLELNSMLYAMNLHKPATALIIAQNSTALTAITYVLQDDERHHRFVDPNDIRIAHTQILEGGQSELARLYALTGMSGNRPDVDGYGYVVIEKYVSPGAKAPVFTIDLTDNRGISYDGLERSTDWHKLPTESVVVYKYSDNSNGINEQYEITATAKVTDTSHASTAARGYTLTDLHSETELNPATQETAQQKAEVYLRNASVEQCEFKLKTKYLPIWEGDVIELVVPDGLLEYQGTRKCLVKSVDLAGPYLDMTLVLKETSSVGDAL